jgi:hypothetical protein
LPAFHPFPLVLQFHDGGTADDPTINSFCGFEEPAPFLSTGNQLHIKFHSDWNREGHGFLFRWEATDEGTIRTTGNPMTNINGTYQSRDSGYTLFFVSHMFGYLEQKLLN